MKKLGDRMEPCILLKGKKYSGNYVAIKSFMDRTIICYGLEAKDVINKAKKKGFKSPVVFYVPRKDMAQIYKCQ